MSVVLLVEDNDLNRDMLGRRLRRAGYEVLEATQGAQALASARERRPDLILMDLSLPVMDGWEATRRLKQDPSTADIPVLSLSAHAMAAERQRAMDAGCDDYDTKPVDWPRLRSKMEALLGG
jgi:two-component system cell cycle response regulator DivK